jgi:hypothetical protein
LIVRMEHDNNVRAGVQCRRVAGLLVSAVTPVALMHMNLQSKLVCQRHRSICAVIVDQNASIHDIGSLFYCFLESLFSVIRRQNDHDPLIVDHSPSSPDYRYS